VRADGRNVFRIPDAGARSVFHVFLVVAVVFVLDDVPTRARRIELRVGRDGVVGVFGGLFDVFVLVIIDAVIRVVRVVAVIRCRDRRRGIRLVVLLLSLIRLGVRLLRESGAADDERHARNQ
jgi:hypothetical protein